MKALLLILFFVMFKYSLGQISPIQKDHILTTRILTPKGIDIRQLSIKIEPNVELKFGIDEFSFMGFGNYHIQVGMMGRKDVVQDIDLISDTLIIIDLRKQEDIVNIDEVNIVGRQWKNSIKLKGTVNSIDQAIMAKTPTFLGEKDVLRTLQTMPGVSVGTEGSAELQVRGGSSDQNLIILDGIPLYNSTHLFGMYSAFNPLIVENVQLFTGAFPSSFGGKISSVIAVDSREASFTRTSGSLELGITSLKGHLELPIFKEKASLLLAGRRSFFESLTLLNQASNKEYFNYYDLNGILTYVPDSKHLLKFSSYIDGDQFNYVKKGTDLEKDGLRKSQQAISLNWKGYWNASLNSDLYVLYTRYSNNLFEKRQRQQGEGSYNNNFRSRISNVGFKSIIEYVPIEGVKLLSGLDNMVYFTDPSTIYGDSNGNPFFERNIAKNMVNEFSPHAQISFGIKGTTLDLGTRFSNVYNGSGSFSIFEPRVSFFHKIHPGLSVKASYAKMSQPIQRLSNPGLGMPLEIIYPGSDISNPQQSDIFTIAAAKDFMISEKSSLSFSIEAYDKSTKNILSFKDGFDTRSAIYYAFGGVYRAASINDMVLSDGIGESRGIDLKLDVQLGNIFGWINYSFSKSEHRFSGLNEGDWFPSLQDRRNVFNSVFGCKINEKWDLSVSWTYSSGRPITLPNYSYSLYNPYPDNSLVLSPHYLFDYGQRNSSRMLPFHRMDFSMIKKTTVFSFPGELTFGVYNLYNRKNPSFYYMGSAKEHSGLPEIRSLSVFPAMPSVSIKVNFN